MKILSAKFGKEIQPFGYKTEGFGLKRNSALKMELLLGSPLAKHSGYTWVHVHPLGSISCETGSATGNVFPILPLASDWLLGDPRIGDLMPTPDSGSTNHPRESIAVCMRNPNVV